MIVLERVDLRQVAVVDEEDAGGLADDESMDQAMTRIGNESRRMAALVEDMLLLARLDQGRPLRHDQVPLSDVINDALLDLRAVDPDRPVEANVQPDVVVTGDEDRLRQVIANLLSNAHRHTPVGSTVTLRIEERTITVSDDGPGIPPELAPHVFGRFVRGDSSRSRTSGGTGLGLAIVEAVVTAHGGTAALADRPGGGTTVTVSLPSP